jgi:hypothetical protein
MKHLVVRDSDVDEILGIPSLQVNSTEDSIGEMLLRSRRYFCLEEGVKLYGGKRVSLRLPGRRRDRCEYSEVME